MSSLEGKLADWFHVTAEVLQRPIVELPVEELSAHILESFDGSALTSNLRDGTGTVTVSGFTRDCVTLGGFDANEAIAQLFEVMDIRLFDYHPLLRWYEISGECRPQTIARVPRSMVAAWECKEVRQILRSFDVDHQLSIPLMVNGREHQAIVISRPGTTDFADDDLRLASSLQHMLTALQRQSEILATHDIPAPALDLLTGRELAVLRCVARGMTAHATGYYLSSSPRTIEKHLQNAYRKLGVHDRVSAVLIAHDIGLLDHQRQLRPVLTVQT